jgi:hypothetical protein
MADKYVIGCDITSVEAEISGKRHFLVRKPNGMSFYMDEFFLDVVKGINDEGLLDSLSKRYGVPDSYVERAVEVVKKGGFVIEEGKSTQ